ncbi:MAG: radical SAM protein [Spirochaetota bacterium]
MIQNKFKQAIHLLYVPTIYCNLGCTYCYLGRQTDSKFLKQDNERALQTLEDAVNKFTTANILPFNISLHGGEVTTLHKDTVEALFLYIHNYYQDNKTAIESLGISKTNPHIKTNLYSFEKFYPLFLKYKVSISASVDLPLSLHDKYRKNKQGVSSLPRTVENLKLLAKYPHGKKLSTTLFQENFQRLDELVTDIKTLHYEYGFDMNRFNFMFGFGSSFSAEKFPEEQLPPISEELQVKFYQRLKAEFHNTDLEPGFHKNWFDEFTPSYCTAAFNCGEKFFLLQGDGTIYSCVRGQGNKPFRYGNIYENSVEEILQQGRHSISSLHKKKGLHSDCQQCDYLHICHTGCAFVKTEQNSSKSYTCALQKEIYRSYPELYPKIAPEQKASYLQEYMVDMHPNLVKEQKPISKSNSLATVSKDFYAQENSLVSLIEKDILLQKLYDTSAFYLQYNERKIPLESQLLKSKRPILNLSKNDKLELFIKKELFAANCKELLTNTLYCQILRDTAVVYGDDKRAKQEHLFTYQRYFTTLEAIPTSYFVTIDLGALLLLHENLFQAGVVNNFLVTTSALREYHYKKQRENGFYHIQAMNLPFQNFEFYWYKE